MIPTLTVIQNRSTDQVVFDCDHATTTLTGESWKLADTERLIGVAKIRHSLTCRCQIQRYVQIWPSMQEALAVFREDDDRPVPEWATDFGLAIRVAAIKIMEERACAGCDPSFSLTIAATEIRTDVSHTDACQLPTREPRVHWIETGGRA